MKLYYAPAACSLAPHIVIREAGLDVALDKVTFGKERTTESGKNFYDINPQGAVPTLELDNGEVLTEAQVLLQYLAAQAPQANLAPAEGLTRWRLLETLNFIATELHKGISPLFRNPSEDQRATVTKTVRNRFELLEGKLGDKEYLLGPFTIADAYAFVTLNWARKFEIEVSPKLQAYFQRILARPAVQQALSEEGLPTS
ncbi:glutathione transferase GstA [Terricaulis sp.]|uniref:glutathione transferase GstA n=1 Tax=Terricaulis sp. TaxID=2768686 RepID=UPI002AC752F8|nr:glutathione transferase GstA [Terricaulis sp.]MDZ4690708.1 glutathione transferase GstA [Terricaulis sp.]